VIHLSYAYNDRFLAQKSKFCGQTVPQRVQSRPVDKTVSAISGSPATFGRLTAAGGRIGSPKLVEAQKTYQRIAKANPNLAEVQFNLGLISAQRRDIPVAAQHFEAALRLKPGQPAIWLAYLDMASHHPRIDNLEKLLARVGSGLDAHPELPFLRGLAAKGRGAPDKARTLIETALSAGLQSARAETELAMLLAATGDTEAALGHLDCAKGGFAAQSGAI